MSKIINESKPEKKFKKYCVRISETGLLLYSIPNNVGGLFFCFMFTNNQLPLLLIETDDVELTLTHLGKEFDVTSENTPFELIEVENGPKLFIPDNKILN